MIRSTSYKGKKVAVFGLGLTGISAALSLASGGADVFAWDDNDASVILAQENGVKVDNLAKVDWTIFEALVLSPGIPDNLPKPHWTAIKARKYNIPIICDVELFAREINLLPPEQKPKVIAITGTNGKSTTTALIGHILSYCGKDTEVGGNIGQGILSLQRMHAGKHYVIELSSYQLERTNSLRADAAVLLNLSHDHLDRHGEFNNYSSIKKKIFDNQLQEDTSIIGVGTPSTKLIFSDLTAKNGRRIIPVSAGKSLGRGVSVVNSKLFSNITGKCIEICDLSKAKALSGRHNHENAAAAYAAIQSLGLNIKEIGEAILSFPGLPHRMENLGFASSVMFVNDSKATNSDASMQALNTYSNIFWILGGKSKSDGIESLIPYFKNVSKSYLIGESAPKFHKTLTKHKVNHKISGTLEKAIICATRDAIQSECPNPVVMLSPSCASFDQFENFAVRGDAFRSHVNKIINLFSKEENNVSKY